MGRQTFKQTDILTNRQIKKQWRCPPSNLREQISSRTSCFHHLRNVNLELELGDRIWEQVELDNNFHEMTKKRKTRKTKAKPSQAKKKKKRILSEISFLSSYCHFPYSHVFIFNFLIQWSYFLFLSLLSFLSYHKIDLFLFYASFLLFQTFLFTFLFCSHCHYFFFSHCSFTAILFLFPFIFLSDDILSLFLSTFTF